MKKNTIILICAYLLLFLFLNVGLSKLMTFQDFKGDLSISPLLGPFVNLIAIPLPILEITVGIGLLFSRTRRIAFIASLIMMLTFTGYSLYLVAFAKDVPCSCGGIFRYLSWRGHLLVNSIFTILAIIGVWISNDLPLVGKKKSMEFIGQY